MSSSPPPSINAPHPNPKPIAEEPLNDPPPPYPSSSHRTRLVHTRFSAATSSDNHEPHQRSPRTLIRAFAVEDSTEDTASETTPLLGGINAGHPESPSSTSHLRPRSLSQSSINSFAPSLASLAQTAWVFFSECEDDDEDDEGVVCHPDRSLTHLVLVNFPFALAAWVYLVVFTVTGTTLLIALPLGAILCFFKLLGARAASELESGQAVVGEEVTEMSSYKNTYSMFTDPTSFQALFYFIVIKPAITLLFITFFLTICVPLLVLVIPAPVVLRVCRRIGRWQAVVAVEGLSGYWV
ncbi:hypothetical protein F5050DRAFT_1801505 [Lentinula boryana]|uniref:Uncharacterized protein n=1 Tax=Lentinula boryana TaxID=40481 RepID=A0ABQ8Q2Q2_9AGAR|nr:hypothetical protein F5050DRAFT_1801505 [Lentinula boryana]